MDKVVYYAIFVCCTLACSFAQIILKKTAVKGYSGIKFFLNKGTVIGYGINTMVTLVIVFLYRYIELSAAALLDSLGYLFIAIFSRLLLNEKINPTRLVGIAFILSGIAIYALFGI